MLSELQKSEIICKHNSGLSVATISETMKIHRNTVSLWVNRYYKTNSVTTKARTGRKRKTTVEDDNKIINIIK
jgi:transposase